MTGSGWATQIRYGQALSADQPLGAGLNSGANLTDRTVKFAPLAFVWWTDSPNAWDLERF